MRDYELLCEIEKMENYIYHLEMEKMDTMFNNGKIANKIKKQNIKLKEIRTQLDQQKAMWKSLKNFIVNRPYYAGYDVQEHGMKVITDIIDKMQELEKGEKDDKD